MPVPPFSPALRIAKSRFGAPRSPYVGRSDALCRVHAIEPRIGRSGRGGGAIRGTGARASDVRASTRLFRRGAPRSARPRRRSSRYADRRGGSPDSDLGAHGGRARRQLPRLDRASTLARSRARPGRSARPRRFSVNSRSSDVPGARHARYAATGRRDRRGDDRCRGAQRWRSVS